jgi:transcriptional regulator with XRE-family HTH domain
MNICSKIKQFRVKQKLSQQDMADKLDMSINAYSRIERDETDLQQSRIEQIAKILGITPMELITAGEKHLYYVNENIAGNINFGYNTGFLISGNVTEKQAELLKELGSLKNENTELKATIAQLKDLVAKISGKQ